MLSEAGTRGTETGTDDEDTTEVLVLATAFEILELNGDCA